MALGATFRKKFNVDKDVTVSTIYSDISIGNEDTLTVQGGSAITGDERCTLFNFTIPNNPDYGSSELENIELNYYIRDLSAFPKRASILSGLSTYRVDVDDITEGDNTILNKPTVIVSNDGNNSYLRDIFDGTKAVEQVSKAYKFETESTKIYQRTDVGYLKERQWDVIAGGGGHGDFAVKDHKQYVEYSDIGTGEGGAKERVVRLKWDRNDEKFTTVKKGKATWPFSDKQLVIEKTGSSLEFMGGSEEAYNRIAQGIIFPQKTQVEENVEIKDFATTQSTIFDAIQVNGKIDVTTERNGVTEKYMTTSATFTSENVTEGGRSLKLHTLWNYSSDTKAEVDNPFLGGDEKYLKPTLLETTPFFDQRNFTVTTGASSAPASAFYTSDSGGNISGNQTGLTQAATERQEVRLSKRIPFVPTNMTGFRDTNHHLAKESTTFMDMTFLIDKLAPAYRSNKNGSSSGATKFNAPHDALKFPRGTEGTRSAATGAAFAAATGMTTARRGMFVTFGDRAADREETLYDYVQDHCLWVCRVDTVDVARTHDAGAGNAVHKFRSTYSGQYLDGSSGATLDYGTGVNARTNFDDLDGDKYKDDAFNGHTVMFINATEKGNLGKMSHVVDYDAGTGAITLDNDLGADVTVGDIFILYSDNVYGARKSDGSALTNPNMTMISRKNFAMIGFANASDGAEQPNIKFFHNGTPSTTYSSSGGRFCLYPPTADVNMGWMQPTDATSISFAGTSVDNFPTGEHMNMNIQWLNDNENGISTNAPTAGLGSQKIANIRFLEKSIRDGFVASEFQGGNTPQGGTPFPLYNANLESYGKYAGSGRVYDDSTTNDDWVDTHTPQSYTPKYMTVWLTNTCNTSRLDGSLTQDKLKHTKSTNPFEVYVDDNGDNQDHEIQSNDSGMESIVFVNSIGIGNVQPSQRNSTFLDREVGTLPDTGRAKIQLNPGGHNAYGTGEETANSFICLGFDNTSDIINSAADPDTATNQKYLLWSGLSTTNEASIASNSGFQFGLEDKTDQIAVMYSNTVERLGDWDKAYTFTEGTYSKASPNRGLGEGEASTDAIDHDSFTNAADGWQQKGFWKMKWHPRLVGLTGQTADSKSSSTIFTCTALNASNGAFPADYFIGWEVLFTDDAETIKVTDSSTSGTITLASAATFEAGDTFDLFPAWEKREAPWASTKVIEVIDNQTFKVANVEALEGFKDDTYIIYRYGTGSSADYTGRGVGFNTTTGKKYYKSGLKIINTPTKTDDGYYIVKLDTSAEDAEDGSTNLLVDDNTQELFICPEKFWLTIAFQNNTFVSTKYELGSQITFDSVCVTDAPNVGTTWNESLFSDAQSNPNSWSLKVGENTALITDRDYGFGELDMEKAESNTNITKNKGLLGVNPLVRKSEFNHMELKGLVDTDKVKVGEKVTINMVPLLSDNSHLFTIDSTERSGGFTPYMTAVYRDTVPTITEFTVKPNEVDPFNLDFTWKCEDDDTWYGFLKVSENPIPNQYSGGIIHLPLNEDGDEDTDISNPTDEIGSKATSAGGGVAGDTPHYSIEGLAGNAVKFSGDQYLQVGTGSDDALSAVSDEFSVVAHVEHSDGVIDDSGEYIISKVGQFQLYVNTSEQVVARFYSDTDDYVELVSTSKISKDIPMNIIATLDSQLIEANCKLFINGNLEDSSGPVMNAHATDNNDGWILGNDLFTDDGILFIGAKDASDNSTFDGKIEEIVFYNEVIYPINPKSGKFTFTKPLKELNDVASASPRSYAARLFVKDYHNIRGKTTSEVAASSEIYFKKAGFRLDSS